MYCRYCGKELPNDSNFCPNCGKNQKESKEIKTIIDNSSFGIIDFIQKHKKITYVYFAWLILHITLYISSGKFDDCEDHFYPFDMPFSYVIQGGYAASWNGKWIYPSINFLGGYLDYYNFTEFFAYVVLLPLLIWGIVRSYPHIKRFWSKMIIWINRWQEDNTKKAEDYQAWKEQLQQTQIKDNLQKVDISETANAESPIVEVTQHDNTETIGLDQDNINESVIITPQHKSATIECESKEVAFQKMPLFSRFMSSMVDKFLILVIFVSGFAIISPYGASGKLGKYMGIRNTAPSTYEYIDRINMDRYQNGEYYVYYEDVDRDYLEKAWATEDIPHIGAIKELDMNITISFILLNLLYYTLFECLIAASPGKRMGRGKLVDGNQNRIGYGRVFLRALYSTILMLFCVFVLHFQLDLCNTIIVIIFFLIMDIPVLFTKRSLLDILTGTTYINR